jgi:hypothetical protein
MADTDGTKHAVFWEMATPQRQANPFPPLSTNQFWRTTPGVSEAQRDADMARMLGEPELVPWWW